MTSVGLIIGLPILIGLPFQIAGGAIADRLGRRVVVIVAACAGVTLFEGLALARAPWQVVAVIAFEAVFGWALYLTANNAMLADFTPPARRSEAYGISRTANDAGMVGRSGDRRPAARGRSRLSRPLCQWRFGLRLVSGFGARLSQGVAAARSFDAPGRRVAAIVSCSVTAASWPCARLPCCLSTASARSTHLARAVARQCRRLPCAVGPSWPPLCRRPACFCSTRSCDVHRSLDKLGLLSLASVCLGIGLTGAAFAPKGLATAACVLLDQRRLDAARANRARLSSRRWPRRSCAVATWAPGHWSG